MARITTMGLTKTGRWLGLTFSSMFLLAGFCFGQIASSHSPTVKVLTSWPELHNTNMARWNPYEKALSVKTVRGLRAKWTHSTGYETFSSPAVANGVVYVGSGDNVYALNSRTGAQLWSYATGNAVFSSPAVADGVVYIGSEDYNVYALDAKTGAKLWSYDTGYYVESSPTVANGAVFVFGDNGNIYALDASSG